MLPPQSITRNPVLAPATPNSDLLLVWSGRVSYIFEDTTLSMGGSCMITLATLGRTARLGSGSSGLSFRHIGL